MKDYLSEDQDLINLLETHADAVTTTDDSKQNRQMIALQAKATLRNRKSISDLDKTTGAFSIILIAFAMVQVVIGLCQFMFEIVPSDHGWMGLGIYVFLLIMVFLIFWKINPDRFIKK